MGIWRTFLEGGRLDRKGSVIFYEGVFSVFRDNIYAFNFTTNFWITILRLGTESFSVEKILILFSYDFLLAFCTHETTIYQRNH